MDQVEPGSLENDAGDSRPKWTSKSFDFAKDGLNNAARRAGTFVGDQVDVAKKMLQEVKEKEPEPYETAIADYNAAFTTMSDKGLELLIVRQRTTDLVDLVEHLINSIANTPKSFEADIAEIRTQRAQFLDSEEFARRDLAAAKKSAAGAGAGFAAAAAVATMAPTAAIWVATTFGTASTGTAISTLSGAAATNATLAWLGGGALAAGGGGTAAGTALLAMAGPIGWGIAGATLLTSIVLFTKKKLETREAKEQALTSLKENTSQIRQLEAQIDDLLAKAVSLREQLLRLYRVTVTHFDADFTALHKESQTQLATLVNNTLACTRQLQARVIDSATEGMNNAEADE